MAKIVGEEVVLILICLLGIHNLFFVDFGAVYLLFENFETACYNVFKRKLGCSKIYEENIIHFQ